MKFQHLPYTPLRITSGFGPRNTGIPGASTYHLGVDIGTDKSKPYTATDGGPVTAVLPGQVISNYYNQYRGWVILIDHGTIDGRNVKTLYQHLKQAGSASGTKVKAGDQIGVMGNTGVGAQLHLHFEIRIDNTCVDPAPYLLSIEEEEELKVEDTKVTIGTTKVPAKLIDGVTYVPLRGIVDAIKEELEVTWDKATGAGVDL